MLEKSIDQISEKDLQSLIDNSVLEGKTIEYKQTLPNNSDSGKKEFLADVSSFANASGGDLIYGIVVDKNTGNPQTLEGLIVENVDQEISRLDSMIRDGIKPRILGFRISPVKLLHSRTALIIRIPKSWISPHRVTFNGHDKFYSRSSNGKYPLDVDELRIAFNLLETIVERIRKFREDRISKIFANETPVSFCETAKIVLHLVPIISFNPAQRYDIDKIASSDKMRLIYSSGIAMSSKYNFDGFLTYARAEKSGSYVLLFKNGIIEAVEGRLLEPKRGEFLIPRDFEQLVIKSLSQYLSVLKVLNVEMPVFIFLSLLGVKGYSMDVNKERWGDRGDPIDRNILFLETFIERYDIIAKDVLQPCFNSVWNACGFPQSVNYNDAGERV